MWFVWSTLAVIFLLYLDYRSDLLEAKKLGGRHRGKRKYIHGMVILMVSFTDPCLRMTFCNISVADVGAVYSLKHRSWSFG